MNIAFLNWSKLIITHRHPGNIIKLNVVFQMDGFLLIKQLLQNHLRLEKEKDLEENFAEKLFLMIPLLCCYLKYGPVIVLNSHYSISSF